MPLAGFRSHLSKRFHSPGWVSYPISGGGSMTRETLLPQIDQDVEQGFDPHLLQMVELERVTRAIDVEDAVLEQMRTC